MLTEQLRKEFLDIIGKKDLRMVFMPIVNWSNIFYSVYGYEILARGPKGTAFEYPDKLFGAAKETNEGIALDLACLESAFRRILELRPGEDFPARKIRFFININPATMLDQRFQECLESYNIRLKDYTIIIEITEDFSGVADQSQFCFNVGKLENKFKWFKTAQDRRCARESPVRFRIALDDYQEKGMTFDILKNMSPRYVKFGQKWIMDMTDISQLTYTFIKGAKDLTNQKAKEMGMPCEIICEGVSESTEDQIGKLRKKIRIPYGQGFYFGKPIERFDYRADRERIFKLSPAFIHKKPLTLLAGLTLALIILLLVFLFPSSPPQENFSINKIDESRVYGNSRFRSIRSEQYLRNYFRDRKFFLMNDLGDQDQIPIVFDDKAIFRRGMFKYSVNWSGVFSKEVRKVLYPVGSNTPYDKSRLRLIRNELPHNQ